MTPRQARRERREAERKAKKLEFKKTRQASGAWSSATENRQASAQPLPGINSGTALAEKDCPEIQPRWNPELEDEFPREEQIRNNAMADRIALKAGLPIPPPGPTPTFSCIEDIREHFAARRKAAGICNPPLEAGNNKETAIPCEAKPADNIGFVSQNKPSRAEINRANAQFSTGPTSKIGKFASSRNSTKHGLASGTILIPGEDSVAFQSFLNDLLDEHNPATPTERLLVEELAQSHWLTQRAIRFQNDCFTADGVNGKQLALFLRYQTTYQRAFYKALSTLLRLKKEAARAARGFVSQTAPQCDPEIGFVSQNSQSESSTGAPGQQQPAANTPSRTVRSEKCSLETSAEMEQAA